MRDDGAVYNLGDVLLDPDPAPARPRPTPSSPQREVAKGRSGARSVPAPVTGSGGATALAGSLSLFAPGCGQLVVGEIAPGLFFLSGVAFCGAFLWSIASTIDGIVSTLALLGIGPIAVAVTAIGTLLAAAMLHVAAVLHAASLEDSAGMRRLPHPVTAGLASLVMPGWGQLLAGHQRRTAFFLLASWATCGAWVVVSPPASRALTALGVTLPVWLRDGFGPLALVAAPLLIWVVAIYDAAAGAAMERRAKL